MLKVFVPGPTSILFLCAHVNPTQEPFVRTSKPMPRKGRDPEDAEKSFVEFPLDLGHRDVRDVAEGAAAGGSKRALESWHH